MNRDEVIAKWNSMQPRERDAWVAEKVMGLELSDNMLAAYPKYRLPDYPDYFRDVPNYSTDIGAAWEVSQKYPIMKLTRTKIFEISPAEYICTFWNDADSGPIEVPATTAQEAVCLAALIAVLTQGEGIEHEQ
ncbi:MAG UNVERIFIED_CONTAM: hypothetical protein MIN83_00245 [Paenibacillus polymyxa]